MILSSSRIVFVPAVAALAVLAAVSGASGDAIDLRGTYHADDRGTPKLLFPDAQAAKVKTAAEYLRANARLFDFPADLSNLELAAVRKSLLGTHTRYRQLLNKLPIEGAEIVVSQRQADGSVFQVYNNTYPIHAAVPAPANTIGRDAALQRAWDHLRVHGRLKSMPRAELMYVPEKGRFRLVYKTLLIVDAPDGYWEHRVDAVSGAVVSVRRHEISEKYAPDEVPDFAAYQGPTSSLAEETLRLQAVLKTAPAAGDVSVQATANGTALMFDPDPRTTLANDALTNTSPAAMFDPAYFSRPLREITLSGGTYYLQGPYVTIADFESPNTAPSTTTTGNWTAKRGNNAFNDVMCYFHIDQNQRYMQSLGYSNAAAIQAVSIQVDSDGVNGVDNSYYIPDINSLAFGHGGVDDDEDADVILHEYGHAITYGINPSFSGGDSGAIGEGFGDYWGASYSWICTNGSTYHPAWAFSWDGHSSDTWSGRFLDRTNLTYDPTHTYVDHETINGIANYSDQLWGTPIYQAFRDLISQGRPRPEMDTIILESQFGVGSGVTMRDMANSTVMAAMELYPSGPHAWAYFVRFTNQLILVSFPLPAPTLTYPNGGQTFATGAVISVQWNRNGAPTNARTRIEYASQLSAKPYFSDNVESGTNGWSISKTGGSDWTVVTSSSHSPTRSWFATDNAPLPSACDQFLTRSSIVVSNGAVLSFWHCYDLEDGYDGAVVEISTNSGATWADLGGNATRNGYNATIDSGYGSPIAGRKAFSGSSGGFVETEIPLDNYVGKTVSLRFRESDDRVGKATGWWVDDISIDARWTAVATTTNLSSYSWKLPATPGTNYGVRVQFVISNNSASAWSGSAAFTLLAGSNAAPTNIVLSSTTVPENAAAGTLVGAFSAQDPDAGNTFVYALTNGTGGADNGSFAISGSNLLTAAVFDYEAKSSYSIRVQATDQGGLSTQKVFVISVSNVNEAPTNMTLSNASVAENLPSGTAVGAFSAQDPDAGNTFVYALTSGTGGTDNGSFAISGSNLLTAASFNYEVQSNYSIRVQATDQGGLSTQKVFVVLVLDVNETPSLLGLDPSTGTNTVLRWSSVTNHIYTVYYSTNLMNGFSVLKSNVVATPAVNSYTDSVQSLPARFWQVTTEP